MKWKDLYPTFLILFFLFAIDFQGFTQTALEKKVNLNVSNTDLKRVLKIIEHRTKVKFAYSSENIGKHKISIVAQDEMISNVLDQILNKQLIYEVVGNLITLRRSNEISNPITVTGKVIDENERPLPVTIRVKESNISTSTEANGTYSIQVPDDSSTLVFSFPEFNDQEIAIAKRSVINVRMLSNNTLLTEIIVIGYGTQKRENVIGSIANISVEKLQNRPVTHLQNALTGQLPGITVTQNDSRPGVVDGAINVRGVGSFGADPSVLVLIDGVQAGGFNDLDPNDVESISVLKDASSAAIYGARAANGVILVTTKTGKEGQSKINYNAYFGFQTPTALPEFADSWQYVTAYAEANGIIDDPSTLEAIEKYRNGNDPENYPNIDFLDKVISKNGIQTSHNIAISGGTKLNQYSISLGYLFQDGVVVKNNYSRSNLRLNMSNVLSSRLKLTTHLAVTNSNRNEPMSPPTQTNTLLDIMNLAVRLPGNYLDQHSNGDWGGGINGNGTPLSQLASASFYKNRNLNFNTSLQLAYSLNNGLKFSFIPSYTRTNSEDKSFQSTQKINPTVLIGPNKLTQTYSSSDYYTLEGLAEYVKQLKKHQIRVLGGYSFESFKNENILAFRDNLPGNDLTVINVGAENNQQSNGTAAEWALESQFARVHYSYEGKYLAEAVVRRDGSSRFPTNNKYSIFPSAAIGWRIGEESFIKNNYSWINELKIKASSGVLGNQNISNYPYQNVLVVSDGVRGTNYSFGGNIATGIARDRIVDSTLHWESTRTDNIGLEFELFKFKLSGSATFFNRSSYDILYSPNSSVSNILGFDLSQQNTGKLENRGWEFTLNYNTRINKLGLKVNSNLSVINNKALDLGVGNITQPNGLIGNGNDLFVGYPMKLFYGYQADGLFVDAADVMTWPHMDKVNPAVQPGDVRYKDISGPGGVPDGQVDPTYDRTYLGSRVPKYTYGINLSLNYGAFDFSSLFQGVGGVRGTLLGSFGFALFNQGNVQKWQFDGRWTPENPDRNAIYPRMEAIGNTGTPNSEMSSFWILNGSYLRIKNLQIGYNLPKNALRTLNMSGVRVYFSGENIYTFSKYRKGWDPEVSAGSNFYPFLTNYSMGLNITF